MYTLQDSINWAQSFIEYSPLTAGTGSEPAVSIATIVRNTILNAPLIWPWNRAEDSSLVTVAGTQDYTVALTDFGYLEKVSFLDSAGESFEVKDVFNTMVLGKVTAAANSAGRGRPSSVCVKSVIPGTSVTLRFLAVPNAVYTATLTYQKLAIPFGSYGITSVATAAGTLTLSQVTVAGASTTYTGTITGGAANAFAGMTFVITGFVNAVNNITITVTASTATTLVCTTTAQVNEINAGSAAGGQAVYTGVFNPATFPAGSSASITGFSNAVNNGTFSVVSATATRLVVVNPAAVIETIAATVFNGNWSPIPDSYMDIFNNLFLAEAFEAVDEQTSAQMYRQRGIAALLGKSEGLSEMQVNMFLAQYLSRSTQAVATQLRTQIGNQARGI